MYLFVFWKKKINLTLKALMFNNLICCVYDESGDKAAAEKTLESGDKIVAGKTLILSLIPIFFTVEKN